MISDQINYGNVKTAFTKELELAAAGKHSSLSYISYSIPKSPLVTTGIVQGIVMGGTNYVVSTRQIFKNGRQKTLSHHWGKLPIFYDLKTLVEFLKLHLDKKAHAVGINFGFPLKPTKGDYGEIDGEIIKGTKEHAFAGVTTPIGQIAREIYQITYKKDIPISVANDSVCLMFSGDGTENGSIIIGTGTNMCLRQVTNNKTTIVNLESGNFDKFPVTSVLKNIDAKLKQPGSYYLEKTIAGKYMALYFNEKAKQLGMDIAPLETSKNVSELAEVTNDQPATKLARAILERSAYLTAAILAGAYEFAGSPETFVVIGEGSVLWKGWHYRKNIKAQLSKLDIPDNTITIKHTADSSINGAFGLLTK